jgi:hypothetical protein
LRASWVKLSMVKRNASSDSASTSATPRTKLEYGVVCTDPGPVHFAIYDLYPRLDVASRCAIQSEKTSLVERVSETKNLGPLDLAFP